MFLVLFFQLLGGFEIFQNKKVRRKTTSFHLEFILVAVPLALPGSPGLLSRISGFFPLFFWVFFLVVVCLFFIELLKRCSLF